MAKDKVKCKGCGSLVWVGAKMYDGYCHDCYARGRHLPKEEDDDQWLAGSGQKKKPRPTTPLPIKSRPLLWRKLFPKLRLPRFRFPKFRRIRHLWRGLLLLLLFPLAVSFIFKGAFWIKGMTVNMAGETTAMNVIREEKNKTFFDKGERMTYEAIVINRRALNEFRDSGSDYRMIGEFVYARKDGSGTLKNNFSSIVSAHVEMSYNSETDVYKFVISNTGTDEKMKDHRIEDGTYYIVNENDKTYVLHDFFGERTATDISKDAIIYNFLMKIHMENALYTGYLDREAEGFSLWGGAYYYRHITIENPGPQAFNDTRVELKTYDNKPVWYLYVYHDRNTGIGCHITLNYYYDNISQDAPKVEEYGG
jgi:hypothetical protein